MNTARPLRARITAQAEATRVDVYDDIGSGGWFSEGLSAKDFSNQIANVTGPLHVHINSVGGNVWDGISIKNAIEAHKGPVKTVVDGVAASIASVIAQAGTERVMMPGSMMMIHDASSYAEGNAAEMAKTAKVLDDVSANLAAIYARTAGGTAEQWRAAMKEETWYNADQAVAAGLADRTGNGAAVLPANFDLAAYGGLPDRIVAQLRAMPHAADGPPDAARHGPFTGTHTHAHTASGEQGGDATHEHEHTHDGDADHGHSHADSGASDAAARLIAAGFDAREVHRILGLEPPAVTDKAFPVHHTATEDSDWDGPAAVKAMPNDDEVLEYCHAWQSAEAAATPHKEGDDDADDKKSNYKFPHHRTKGGPANTHGCSNGLARLEGSNIPEADKAGVRAHLQAHLDDAHKDDDEGTENRAGLPAWIQDHATPLPAWFTNPAEEAK